MRPHWKTITFIVLMLPFAGSSVFAQFNLNKFNGLPSNHVYKFLTDRYGYLWMATEKGVLRYNGYEVKLFNTSQDMGNSDIWNIYQDRKGRIWMHSFSTSFGYIYNNRYHKAVENAEVIYPSGYIYESEDGLFFCNNKPITNNAKVDNGYLLYREFYGARKRIIVEVCEYEYDGVRLYESDGYTYRLKKECIGSAGIFIPKVYGSRMARYRNHAFIYVRKKNKLVHLDLNTCRYQVMLEENGTEGLSYVQTPGNDGEHYIYIYYRDHVDKLDTALGPVQSFKVSEITGKGVSGNDLVFILEDSLWGKCVASESNGAFISSSLHNPFRKSSWNAEGFSLISSLNDSTGYWWNERTHILAKTGRGTPRFIKIPRPINYVQDVLPYNEQSDIILIYSSYYCLLDKKTGKIGPPEIIERDTTGISITARYKQYTLSNREMEVLTFGRQGVQTRKLLNGKFREIISDPMRGGHWLYNQHNLYFINKRNSCIRMNSLLKKLSVANLEKLLVDDYGNMLLLVPNKLICYSSFTSKVTELLPNCNLTDARIAIGNNVLVAAGKFGVAFIRIGPSGQYGAPFMYHNIKNTHYTFVNDMQLLKNGLLLQTDAGTYTVAIPAKDTVSADLPCRFWVQYNDSVYNEARPMINMAQENKVLQFELVRPSGNGTLKYMYRIDGIDSVWKDLNANELLLPALEADEQYTLSVIAKDDVWKSDIMHIQLYVKPYWWQSSPGVQIIWIAGLLFTAGILFITVISTRSLIEKRNARHRQLLELELKAVYAQINPHFIFNTLNSGLHLIKKQKTAEAYQHILRFSQLLRAYLKASRHRYITLAEEITNLTHYIELQQTRFGHVFEYTIHLEQIPDPGLISIPSLLLQPIVENAIEHGLLPGEKQGHLDIRFTLAENGKQLSCTISDNGVGRRRSKTQHKYTNPAIKTESYGDNLIKELINLFNKYEKMGIEISYEDLPDPNPGTIVRVIIQNPRLFL